MIAAVIGPRVVGYLGRAKSETATLQMTSIRDAVNLFYVDTGRFPTDAEGLQSLISRPPGDNTWAGPYLQEGAGLTDPWGRGYLYQAPSSDGDFSIKSLGRDGSEGGSGEDADLRV